MGTLYIDTGGSATNSGSSDQNAADLSGSAATVAASVVTLDGSPDLTNVDATPTWRSPIVATTSTRGSHGTRIRKYFHSADEIREGR